MSAKKPSGGGGGGGSKQGSSPFAALKELKGKVPSDESSTRAKAPAKREPATKPRVDPDEEALTFHRMMSGVTPLDKKKERVAKTAAVASRSHALPIADARAREKEEIDEVHAHLRALVEGKARFEVEDDGLRVEGRRVDMPIEALRRLRRGIVPIDARIDLHGLTAAEARDAIEVFLRDKRVRGDKCVLVVHGKGDHSPRGMGVMRGEIAAWLSQGPASEHVAAFATAAREDGGEGAVYVLLRR